MSRATSRVARACQSSAWLAAWCQQPNEASAANQVTADSLVLALKSRLARGKQLSFGTEAGQEFDHGILL